MKKKDKRLKIYRLTNFTINEIVDKYMELHREGTFYGVILDKLPKIRYEEGEALPKKINKGSVIRKSQSILESKFIFLIHALRTRLIGFENATHISLHSSVLEYILGEDYKQILSTLEIMGIIDIIHNYEIGVRSKAYGFKENMNFIISYENPQYLSNLFNKYNKWFEEYKLINITHSVELLGETMYNRYNKSLGMLKLRYKDECYRYLQNYKFLSERSKEYYYSTLEKYQTEIPHIYTVDDNKRIYSILTSTPRVIKNFLNLKFTCDIHNSHPLLLNSIIYDYYDFPKDARIFLSEVFNYSINSSISNIDFHHLRYLFCKWLKDSKIENNKITKMPIDVYEYMFLTSTGQFWDEVLPKDNTEIELTRNEIKVKMFSEVFYSKVLKTPRWKKYATIFRNRFPNVYKIILEQKVQDPTQLANDMMKLESSLFQEILRKLYNKRYKVVTIHDAIAVLDCKANDSLTQDDVKQIIMDVYKAKVGLLPDISVDFYGENTLKSVISNQQKEFELINEFMERLTNMANEGDEEVKEILELIYTNEVEVIADIRLNICDLKWVKK